MRKYLLIFFTATIGSLQAQISFSDDFESYANGAYLAQSSTQWSTWGKQPGSSQDVQVTNAKSYSGNNSIYFNSTVKGGGPVDCVLPFGKADSTGQFDLELYLFVEKGTAYFNLQADETVGKRWAADLNFKDDGTFSISNIPDGSMLNGTYSKNKWINVKLSCNLNTATWELLIDNVSIGKFSNSLNSLAGLDIYPLDSSSYYIDDVKLNYTPYTLPKTNCAALNILKVNGILSGLKTFPQAVIRNVGTSTITSCDLRLDYNGVSQMFNLTSANIKTYETYTITFLNEITLVPGSKPVIITISNVNGKPADDDASDDSKTITVNPVVPAQNKIVIMEEGTGTWCGWCPRGAVFLNKFDEKFGSLFQGIAVHDNDVMAVHAYDSAMKSFLTGYPSALIDRGTATDPSGVEGEILQRLVVAPAAVIKNGAKWDYGTNELLVSLTTTFNSNTSGDYRMVCVLIEDSVSGKGNLWDQHNYYTGNSSGVMGGFENLPNPVPAAQMTYRHVARAISPNMGGSKNNFPASIVQGTNYVFNFRLPKIYFRENKVRIIGMLIDPSKRIDNGSSTTIDEAIANGYVTGKDLTGIETPSIPDAKISVYPNPTTGGSIVNFNIEYHSSINIEIYAIDGRKITSKNYGNMNSGSYNIPLNTEMLSKGIYIVKMSIGNEVYTSKLLVE